MAFTDLIKPGDKIDIRLLQQVEMRSGLAIRLKFTKVRFLI